MLAAVLAAVLATAPTAPDDAAEAAPEADDAKAVFDRARAHAREQRYEEAIADFEEALRLRPSPGLHYNIAVCHHRLLLAAAEDSAEHERHRAAAVVAYNAYLDAAPDAGDRYAVAATIQQLGGRPNVIDDWRVEDSAPPDLELRWDEAETDAEADADPEEPSPPEDTPEASPPDPPLQPPPSHPPTPARTPMRPGFPHGMFGLGVAVDAVSPVAMSRTAGVDSAPALGPVLRAGGFIGKRRELLLGGEFGWTTTTTPANRGHRISTMQFLVLVEWARAVRGPLQLGVSTTAGLGGQSLSHAGPSPASCPVRNAGIVSTRGGVLLGGRFLLRAVFGGRGRHAIALRTGPTLAGFGGGTKDSNCARTDSTPFAGYDFGGAGLLLRSDLSYAFRW